MLLTSFRHIRDVDRASHEARPRLFRERLRGDKPPELALRHDDFRYAMFQNPALQRRQPNLIAIIEHGIGYGFFHDNVSSIRRSSVSSARFARRDGAIKSGGRAVRGSRPKAI